MFSASATGAALTMAKEARMEMMVILVSPNILYRFELIAFLFERGSDGG